MGDSFNSTSVNLFLGVVLLFGLGMTGYGAYSYSAQSEALDSTETVNATIVSTSVDDLPGQRGADYRPQATFNYTYNGETYTSSNLYPASIPRDTQTESAAREKLEGYEPGTTATAHVPTDSPGDAFLKNERTDQPLYFIGFGAIFALGSTVLMLRNRIPVVGSALDSVYTRLQ